MPCFEIVSQSLHLLDHQVDVAVKFEASNGQINVGRVNSEARRLRTVLFHFNGNLRTPLPLMVLFPHIKHLSNNGFNDLYDCFTLFSHRIQSSFETFDRIFDLCAYHFMKFVVFFGHNPLLNQQLTVHAHWTPSTICTKNLRNIYFALF